MSLDSLSSYTLGFGLVLVLGLAYAAVRRSVPVATAALFGVAPAPFFGFIFARYEASLPPGMNIRLDSPFMWVALAVAAAFSVAFAVYLVVHFLAFVGGRLWQGEGEPGPLRSWQHLGNPRGAAEHD